MVFPYGWSKIAGTQSGRRALHFRTQHGCSPVRTCVYLCMRCKMSKADVRPVGVICYAFLTGTTLFDENVREPSTKSFQGRPSTSAMRCLSHNARAFINLLMSVDTSIRPNAVVPLHNTWPVSLPARHALFYTTFFAVVHSSQ